LPLFTEAIARVKLNPPRIPFVSNVSGAWITDAQATDPAYWAQHMRRTVRFADGAGELLKNPKLALLEVGPGQALSALTRQESRARISVPAGVDRLIVSSLPGAQSSETETEAMLSALGQLWLNGAAVDWTKYYGNEPRGRIRMPTYPFERKRFWIEPAPVMLVPRRSADGFVHANQNGPSNGSTNGELRNEPADEAVRASSPREQLTAELRALFGKLLGLDLATVSGATTFLEMGFDSLMLTQASQGIEKKFGARIPFGQLMGKLSTFDLLASALDGVAETDRTNRNGAPANRVANSVKEERT
jgi:acyl transferase domain-containing protein